VEILFADVVIDADNAALGFLHLWSAV
jgi:hypothetical protein